MVKLHFSVAKKRCKNGKVVYQYERSALIFPRDLYEFMLCLKNKQLEIKATREGKVTHIYLIQKDD
jgi:hypothetical protein